MADDAVTASVAPAQPEQRIVIRNDRGDTRNIGANANELAQAKSAGYHVENDEEYLHRKREEKFGGIGGGALAATAGAARGLTFGGLSDVALTKLGLVNPETLEALKDVHPVASTAGEVAGTVGGALLGGESLVGEGVATGARVGEAAGGWIARQLGTSALAKIAATAGGAAAEGGLYGLGQVASEDALGEHELTAEHVLSTVGLSMLTGGGVAAGLHGAGAALKLAAKGVGKATEGAAGLYGKVAQKLGSDIEPELMQQAVTGELGGAEGMFHGKLSGPKWDITPEGREQIASSLGDGLQHVFDTAKSIGKEASNARPQEVRQILDAAEDTGIARTKANELAKTVRDAAKEMAEGAESESHDAGVAKRIKRFLWGKPKEAIEGLAEEGGEGLAENALAAGTTPSPSSFLAKINAPGATHADIFDAANEMKGKLADEARFDLRPDQFAEQRIPDKNSIQKARDLWSKFQAHLEDQAIYGEAGARQASYNRATADFIKAQEQFLNRFGSRGELDRVKINTYLHQIGTAQGLPKENALSAYLDKTVAYIGEAGKTLKSTGSALDDTQMLNHVAQVRMQKAKAIEALGQISKMRAFGFGMPEPDRIIEGMIRMEPQTLTGVAIKTAKTLMSPAGVVKVLGSVNRASKIAQEKIIGGAERLLSTSAGKAAKGLVAPLSVEIANQVRTGRKEDMPEEQTTDPVPTKQRAKEILQMAGDPKALQTMIERSIAGMDQAAPKLSGHIAAKMTGAIMFLAQKAQEMGKPQSNPLMPASDRWDVPQEKLSSFQRYLAAVHNPHSVIEDAANLRPTPEGVETLRTVYPRMYQQVQQATVQRLSQMKTPLPYARRIAIGQLIGMPLDYLQDPQNLAMFRQSLQVGDATASTQIAGQSPAPSKSFNASKVKSVAQAQTTTDRLMAG